MPLRIWFWAAYLVTSQTTGISAVQLQRQLGLTRYETAFALLGIASGTAAPTCEALYSGEWQHLRYGGCML